MKIEKFVFGNHVLKLREFYIFYEHRMLIKMMRFNKQELFLFRMILNKISIFAA
jgi:hypothetical protein